MMIDRLVRSAALLTMATAPAVAQAPAAPTDGRSLATLADVGLRAPDGAAATLGQRVEPGKPTLIAFWASWCMPCMAEAPQLAALRRRYGGRYAFVYLNRRDGDPDPRQPAAAVDAFVARAGLGRGDYLVADVAAYRRILGADAAAIPAGIVGIPRVYLFDRHGRQVYTAMGFGEARAVELERRLGDAVAAR